MINIKIYNESSLELPKYAKPGDAGMDLLANINESIVLAPLCRCIIPTGIYLDIPEGYEIQVRPRSGMSIKYGVTVLNAPGTIDSSYVGEVGVILVNLSNQPFTVERGMRVAQMVCAKVEQVELKEVEIITKQTLRGRNSYGSTGDL